LPGSAGEALGRSIMHSLSDSRCKGSTLHSIDQFADPACTCRCSRYRGTTPQLTVAQRRPQDGI